MPATGFLALEFLALSVQYGFPQDENGARIFAFSAVVLFGICAAVQFARGKLI